MCYCNYSFLKVLYSLLTKTKLILIQTSCLINYNWIAKGIPKQHYGRAWGLLYHIPGVQCTLYGIFLFRLLLFRLMLFRLVQFRLLPFRLLIFFLLVVIHHSVLFAWCACAQFIEYFEETWLNGQYHVSEWSVWDEDGPRTNNHVEGWHNKMNKLAGKSHPNIIYELVDLFKAEQAVTEVTLRQLEAGGVVAPTCRVFRLKEKRLKTIQEKFSNNDYTLEEFNKALSNWVGFR